MAKSNEVKLNEALEQLKTASTSKYTEVCEKLRTFTPSPESLPAQLAMVEEALTTVVKESAGKLGLENIEESKRVFPALFAVKPRAEVIKENLNRPIKKNNGASDNGRGVAITEADPIVARKEKTVASLMESGISEAEARGTMGLGPKDEPGMDGLKGYQIAEYRFARRIGLSESDARKVATLPLAENINPSPRMRYFKD